jgi:hypothetical protein
MSAGYGKHLNWKADTAYLLMNAVRQLLHTGGRINTLTALFHKV